MGNMIVSARIGPMVRLTVVSAGLLMTTLLGGCGHGGHDVGDFATVIVKEGPSEASYSPTPVEWGPASVTSHAVGEVRGPRAVAEEDGPYLLDTGDKLRIFVYGQPSLSRLYTVDHAGQISVPLIGHVHARGNTTGGLERTIKARLGVQYVKDPHVTVDISQTSVLYSGRSPFGWPISLRQRHDRAVGCRHSGRLFRARQRASHDDHAPD
jgi:Polysaccharide biosynthesis/export protein